MNTLSVRNEMFVKKYLRAVINFRNQSIYIPDLREVGGCWVKVETTWPPLVSVVVL